MQIVYSLVRAYSGPVFYCLHTKLVYLVWENKILGQFNSVNVDEWNGWFGGG